MKYLLILVFGLVLSGCATDPRADRHPRFTGEQPRSVLVLPPSNHSTAAEASDLYRTSIAVPLARAGYYVFPTELTMRIMRDEGIIDGAQLEDVDPYRFYELFGADTVLKTTIHQWDTSYFVIGGAVTVSVSFELVSTHTGNVLWRHSDSRSVDTTSYHNSSLLGALIETAFNTVEQDYISLARDLNHSAFAQLPYGVYHPRYQPVVEYTGESTTPQTQR